ncbi:MAG: MFS transporter [Chthonomonadales bacterium]
MRQKGSVRALALSTVAFAISFAVWGIISPMAQTFKKQFGFTDQQTWMLISVPVLLGSVMRLPLGMLADRYGGRIVFGLLLLFISVPAYMLSGAQSFGEFLFWGLLLGMAGTSFSIGIAFTSKWFPPEKQGLALGVYGAGNIGQSIALWGIPALALRLGGWRSAYQVFAAVALVYGVCFLLLAHNAPVAAKPKSFSEMLKVLAREPRSWLLSLFYFVTFGGFVALSIGLPKLLQEIFKLTAADAGLRVAGFVVLATAMRPIGGWLSDRIGGARVLMAVFSGAGILALGLTSENIVPFSIGALGVAAFIGLGNGAVFKLVPQFFPKDTGTVTGLVGAMGGLGGFFPPLVLGIIKKQTGAYDLGFILLSVFCAVCLVTNYAVFLKQAGSGRVLEAAGPLQPEG